MAYVFHQEDSMLFLFGFLPLVCKSKQNNRLEASSLLRGLILYNYALPIKPLKPNRKSVTQYAQHATILAPPV